MHFPLVAIFFHSHIICVEEKQVTLTVPICYKNCIKIPFETKHVNKYTHFLIHSLHRCRCPAHSKAYSGPINRLRPGSTPSLGALNQGGHNHGQHRCMGHEKPMPEYAFEVKLVTGH